MDDNKSLAISFIITIFIIISIVSYINQQPNINQTQIIEVGSEYKNDKLKLNEAGATELKTIPGVGETIARRIVEYRENKGEISSIYELRDIEGVGVQTINNIKQYAKP